MCTRLNLGHPRRRTSTSRGRALVNGTPGAVVAMHGRAQFVMAFTVTAGRIVAIDVLADPDRLRDLDLPTLDPP